MFELSVDDLEIKVLENGNGHAIPISMTHWSSTDLLSHWAFEIYQLLDGYDLKLLFLNTTIERSGQGYLRSFRAVSTRNRIHFDDIRIAVPWKVRSWDPMESIKYAFSSEGQSRIDYSFDSPGRIPEFSVSHEELSDYLYARLERRIPEGYRSNFKLFYDRRET